VTVRYSTHMQYSCVDSDQQRDTLFQLFYFDKV
jgi:hypothetical protein